MTVVINQGDIVKVTACMSHEDTGDVQNVFWLKQITGGNEGTALLAQVHTKFTNCYTYVDDFMPDKVSFDLIKGFNITTETPIPDYTWSGLTVGGVDVADPMPSSDALLITGYVDAAKVRWRKYIGPFTEADHGNGLWQSSLLTAATSFATYILQAFESGSGTAQFGVWSEVYQTWYPVLSILVDAVVSTQRRRKKGRGS